MHQGVQTSMLELALPWALALLPLPILMFWLPAKTTHNVAPLRMPSLITVNTKKAENTHKKTTPIVILSIIWMLLVVSASQPQWLGEPVNVPTEGRELMIAIDLSGSMQIEDMQLNGHAVDRLTMLKEILGDFIERRQGDKLGLILFADDAYMQTPMTFDRKTVQQMLDESVLGLVGKKTAIGDAIGLAVKRFDEKANSNKVLLLMTDGQNTAGRITPEEGLELAIAKDVTIYSIGIGADSMVKQTFFGKRKINPSNDLDEASLIKLAKNTQGQYFRAKSTQDMNSIYQLLDQLEPIEQDFQQMRPLQALFYWPLGAAFITAFMYIFIHALFISFRPFVKQH